MTTSETTAAKMQTSDVLTNGLVAMELSRQSVLALFNDVPEDQLSAQPFEGANHMLWQMGHLAVTDDQFRQLLAGSEGVCPAGWTELFGMGSEPVGDALTYPSLVELKEKAAEARNVLIDWFKSQSDEKLREPTPAEIQSLAPTVGAVMSAVAFHEGMHIGQITVLRKALGLPRVFA